MDDEHWQSHLDINLTGTFRVTRAFLPGLVAEGWGRVINIASTAGKVGFQYTAAYCASKHGVIGLTRALALEMASENGTVNAIRPGFVNTDMTSEAARNIAQKTGGSEADALRWLKKFSPQNRFVEPGESPRSRSCSPPKTRAASTARQSISTVGPSFIEALADALLRVSQLVMRHPEIAEMDINPLISLEDGLARWTLGFSWRRSEAGPMDRAGSERISHLVREKAPLSPEADDG